MRRRLHPALAPVLAAGLIVSACATGRGPPRPPPPPSGPVRTLDATRPLTAKPAAAIPRQGGVVRSAPAGASCRYCVTDDASKRQYFDQRRKRYYYFDRSRKGYFWENGDNKL